MDKVTQLTSARRRRGVVKASVTRLEDCIQIFKLRRELSNADRLAIPHLLKRLEEQETEFKKYHYVIVKLLEMEEDLDQEQATLDDHNDKFTDFISRLQVLVEKRVSEPAEDSVTSTPPLGRRVHPFSSPPFRRRCFVAAVSSPAISSRGHFVARRFVARTLRRQPFRRGDTSSPAISSLGHFVARRFVAGKLH